MPKKKINFIEISRIQHFLNIDPKKINQIQKKYISYIASEKMSLLAFLLFFLPVLFLVIYVLTSSKRKSLFYFIYNSLLFHLFSENQNQKKGKVAVNNSEIMVPLLEKIKLTHDTYDFIFKLPEDDMVLGIGVGQCIVLS